MSDREHLAAVAERFRARGLSGKPGSLSRLFDFLLVRTLAGDAPKEIEIALEVFGKSPTFDVLGMPSCAFTCTSCKRQE